MAGLQASFFLSSTQREVKGSIEEKAQFTLLGLQKRWENKSRTGQRKKRRMIMWGWCVWFRPVPLLRLWVSCMTPCWRSLTPPASFFLASSISSDLLTPYISTSSLCFHFVGNRSSRPCTSPSPLPTFPLFISCLQIFFTFSFAFWILYSSCLC